MFSTFIAMDPDGNINVMLLVALVLAGVYHARRQPRIQYNSVLTGDLYYKEIMSTGNVNRFRQVARMDKATFNLLHANLVDGGLSNSMHICAVRKYLFFSMFSVGTPIEKLMSGGSTLVQLFPK